MEGKAILFKEFGGVDAFPICLRTKDAEKIVETVKLLEPTFGGINLEDISAPRCFEIEERLKQELSIPVFHDDQHGAAIVVLAALGNALKVVGKKMGKIRIVISGAGAAGMATGKFLLSAGARDIILCDTRGAIYEGREEGMNKHKEEFAQKSNRERKAGSLADMMDGADVFVGLSAGGIVSEGMAGSMNEDAIVFAMANPVPEILPGLAKKAGAKIVGTGRSDYPNQINNLLAFPGVFRGALDVRARDISEGMKLAASKAIGGMVAEGLLSAENILPSALDRNVAKGVASAVARQAKEEGLAREWPR
jgi:malate dehydrogenase (oxaloacetate-decarboxylating)